MADTSRIGAAQDNFKTLIAARQVSGNPIEGVPLDVGFPDGGPQAEHIWVSGRVDDWDQEWETTGPATGPDAASRQETFTLTVVCVVSAATVSWTEARDRVLAIAAEVARAALGDDTLAGAVFQSLVSGGKVSEGILPEARQAVAEIKLSCTAYLK
ncbi:MAG: hypothetical protein ACRD02_12990 [Acidimicrobiia bacterium]